MTPVGGGRSRLRARLTTGASRLTLKWLSRIAFVLILAASALFGGLNDAEAAPIPVLAAGETHLGTPLNVTVTRAVVLDEIEGVGITAQPGNRLILVVVELENTWTSPLATGAAAIRIDGLMTPAVTDAPAGVFRLADESNISRLQPRLETEVAFIWEIAADVLADEDPITVNIYDQSLFTFTSVAVGEQWTNPVLAATISLPVEDLDLQ